MNLTRLIVGGLWTECSVRQLVSVGHSGYPLLRYKTLQKTNTVQLALLCLINIRDCGFFIFSSPLFLPLFRYPAEEDQESTTWSPILGKRSHLWPVGV